MTITLLIRGHLWQIEVKKEQRSKERAPGCGKVPYGFQQHPVVSEGAHHANKRNGKDCEAQEDENDCWGKEEPFQGPVLLSFHFSINAHTEDDKADHLRRSGRKNSLEPPRQAPFQSQAKTEPSLGLLLCPRPASEQSWWGDGKERSAEVTCQHFLTQLFHW